MRLRASFAATLGAIVLASGCATAPDPSSGGTVTVSAANGAVTVPADPRRIVSLSPTHTETLFAIGAGDRVVAVDDQSDYPAQAPRTALSGYQPNAEAVIGYKPDLVVVSGDQNGLVAALGKVGVPVLVEPSATDLQQAYDEIADLGAATGKRSEADALIARMRSAIDETIRNAPRPARTLTYFHELDPQLYTVTSATFIGRVYSAFGLQNVADAADPQGSGYPQFSREALVRSDPDLYFLADGQCCGQTPEVLAQRPGFADLRAVRDGTVITLDEDLGSRWGPRLPEFYRAVADAVRKVPVAP